ncbi:MAG: MATE family efflux transporter [Clostridia bacterium]
MKELDLGKEKISKLLLTFAIPCIISMLINSIYNIVDQIFIGKGVGSLGNAATNVIFPIVIICTGIAQLIGNGCAANLSLLLGQGKKKEAKNSVGTAITVLFIASLLVCGIGEIFLPKLVYLFGCTENAYELSMIYGRIILAGAPFMIIYTGLSAIIRSDGSPKYSMVCLLSGAIVNLILDPVLIFGFDQGVAGGAIATILGQILSCVIAIVYLFRMKTIKLELVDYKIDKSILKTLSYGTSSFIIQMTVLALFITMNNVMTKYGVLTKYGADIPLSVYGVVSKLNNLYVSFILGLAVGSQPILGFNFGAGKFDRVKETIRKVVLFGFIIGIVFNLTLQLIPTQLIDLFATKTDPNYNLFIEFGVKCCRIFLMICFLNAFEMTCSIVFQSLGSVKKASFVSFLRQIILFIPLCLIISSRVGLMGALYAGPIADAICFVIVTILFIFEYKKIGKEKTTSHALVDDTNSDNVLNTKVIITISREYGSGGRYIGRMVADKLGIKFYDKDLIKIVSKEAGMTEEFIEENEQKREWGSSLNSEYNSDDKLFIAETKVIKEIANNHSCVIIGRCADYILKDNPNVIKIFIYSSQKDKINRAVKYYNMDEKTAKKEIEKVNKERAKHYKYYTNKEWADINNYDFAFNSDYLGVENTAELIKDIVMKKYNI